MFTTAFNRYACIGDTITCTVDGFTATATVYRDDCNDKPDQRDDGFWPSKDKNAAGYVLPGDFETAMAKATHVMKAWQNDEWFYCGVAVTIERDDVRLTKQYAHAVWGIDCNYPDSDNSYLMTVANELIGDAMEDARAMLQKLCA